MERMIASADPILIMQRVILVERCIVMLRSQLIAVEMVGIS